MRRRGRPAAGLVRAGGLLLVMTAAVHAQRPGGPAPQDRAFLEGLALARARALMLEQVWALPLKAELAVGRWASREVEADRALRLWCRTLPRYAGARFYSDATCDVDIRLLPGVLERQLVELLRRYPALAAAGVGERDLARAAKSWAVLWSTGTGGLPERSRTRRPDGWQDVTNEGVQVTRRAAAAAARHALLTEAGRLKVTPAHRLSEFLESSAAVAEAVQEALRSRATVTVEYGLDQVAVAEARLELSGLIPILSEVYRRHYEGDVFHAADFREMALLVGPGELRATGLAVPPSRYIRPSPLDPIELDAPPWARRTLSAAGRYTPAAGDDFAEIVRVELARFDGMDRLRRQVAALVVEKGVTVEQFLGYHRELKNDVAVFLNGTRVVGWPKALPDGGVEVQLELALRRLWHVVRRGMKGVAVDPRAAAGAGAGRCAEPVARPQPEETR